MPQSGAQAAQGAEARVSAWGARLCSVAPHPPPAVRIRAGFCPRGRVEHAVYRKANVNRGRCALGSDSHLQPTAGRGAKAAQHSASPRRARGGSVAVAGSMVPRSSLLPAQAELQSKADSSLCWGASGLCWPLAATAAN